MKKEELLKLEKEKEAQIKGIETELQDVKDQLRVIRLQEVHNTLVNRAKTKYAVLEKRNSESSEYDHPIQLFELISYNSNKQEGKFIYHDFRYEHCDKSCRTSTVKFNIDNIENTLPGHYFLKAREITKAQYDIYFDAVMHADNFESWKHKYWFKRFKDIKHQFGGITNAHFKIVDANGNTVFEDYTTDYYKYINALPKTYDDYKVLGAYDEISKNGQYHVILENTISPIY